MIRFSSSLLRIKTIAGMFYSHANRSDTLVIYGLGAPVVPDNGSLPDALTIMDFNVDLFVPDYIGYGRSDGRFTPRNCINTFLFLYSAFSEGAEAVNYYLKSRRVLKYDRIILIGRSLGGTYLPLLPRFNDQIKEIGLLYPAIDNPSSGFVEGEESNEDFLRAMERDGYHYLYRGILDQVWQKHLNGEDDLQPVDNLQYLGNARLFIGHGQKDSCINYSKSVDFFKKLNKQFSHKSNQFRLELYRTGGHDVTTSKPAIMDFLNWLGVSQVS